MVTPSSEFVGLITKEVLERCTDILRTKIPFVTNERPTQFSVGYFYKKPVEPVHHPDVEQMLDDLKWDELPPRLTVVTDIVFNHISVVHEPYLSKIDKC